MVSNKHEEVNFRIYWHLPLSRVCNFFSFKIVEIKCWFVCVMAVNVSVCWLARQFNSSDKSTPICSNGICYLNEHLLCFNFLSKKY